MIGADRYPSNSAAQPMPERARVAAAKLAKAHKRAALVHALTEEARGLLHDTGGAA